MEENKSEVARILAQIQEEFEAAQRALSGLAQGTSQHTVITKKMENMYDLQEQLLAIVGNDGIVLVATMLDTVPKGSTTP